MDAIKNKPWVTLRMTRKEFEALIGSLPPEIFDEIKLQADAEHLMESIFGDDAKE